MACQPPPAEFVAALVEAIAEVSRTGRPAVVTASWRELVEGDGCGRREFCRVVESQVPPGETSDWRQLARCLGFGSAADRPGWRECVGGLRTQALKPSARSAQAVRSVAASRSRWPARPARTRKPSRPAAVCSCGGENPSPLSKPALPPTVCSFSVVGCRRCAAIGELASVSPPAALRAPSTASFRRRRSRITARRATNRGRRRAPTALEPATLSGTPTHATGRVAGKQRLSRVC